MLYLLKNRLSTLWENLVIFLFVNSCCISWKVYLVTDITEFSSEAKETCKWVNTANIQMEIIMVSSKMRNYAVPPDHSHSSISFSSTCNIPKHC